ncbi:hypothetical protein [Paludisphaera rhizosphaerae]|uniref:hypothetical protein n=1 Tax=Paludisphaera rhizosphaerae TaxID=2711216 RepID=UPI0013EB55CA|nr:hypothetical protein [Paludisphaera rhizosphaerae]
MHLGRFRRSPATLEDLAHIKGKAELIDGRIVYLPLACHGSGRTTRRILHSPGDHADAEPAVPGWRMDVDHIFA